MTCNAAPAYYNDNGPFCCEVLRARIADGSLPAGVVDERDIREVDADELRGYRQIHLFAGIGGFPLGLRYGGLPDDFDILTGGFPCQPYSAAGQRRGAADDRHLWPEMLRVITAVRPAWVLGENVANFARMGLDQALSDLEALGYACQPFAIPACAVQAPQERQRVWIVAYSERDGRQQGSEVLRPWESLATIRCQALACPEGVARQVRSAAPERLGGFAGSGYGCGVGEDSGSAQSRLGGSPDGLSPRLDERWPAHPDEAQHGWEPPRLTPGMPNRVARIRALGNAVVPQVVAALARHILAATEGGDAA